MKYTKAILALVLGAALAFVVAQASRGLGRITCSPTAVRPWATEDYANRTRPVPPDPWPTIISPSRPAITVAESPGSATVTYPWNRAAEKITWTHFERVEVGPSMSVQLPHDPGTTVELLYWRTATGPWLSPLDGQAIAPPPDAPSAEHEPDQVRFVLRYTGNNVRFHGSNLLDRATHVQLSTGSSWVTRSDHTDEVRIDVNAYIRHRADLMLEVPLVYGQPEVRELELSDGASVDFGVRAEVGFVARGAGRIRSRRTSVLPGTYEEKLVWDTPIDPEQPGWTALSVIPGGLQHKLQHRLPGEARWSSLHGNDRTYVDRDMPLSSNAIELRYLPHAARLQFHLPPPSSLPEVDDLLQVELGDVEFDSTRTLGGALAESMQFERRTVRELKLDKLRYPVVLESATPADLLDLVARRAEPGAHVNTNEFRFSSEYDSMLTRVWKRIRPWARRIGI